MKLRFGALLLFAGSSASIHENKRSESSWSDIVHSISASSHNSSLGGCNGMAPPIENKSYPADIKGPMLNLQGGEFNKAIAREGLQTLNYSGPQSVLAFRGNVNGHVQAAASACNQDPKALTASTGYFVGIAYAPASENYKEVKAWLWADNYGNSPRVMLIDMDDATKRVTIVATLDSRVGAWPTGYEKTPGTWMSINGYDRIQVMIGPNSYIATTEKIP